MKVERLHRPHRFLVCLSLAGWLLGSVWAQAQEGLAAAKQLYSGALYQEALEALDRLPATERETSVEVLQVRAFTLMALLKNDEARTEIERIYTIDPMFRVDATHASPRIVSVFNDVRKAVLPKTVQREYGKARDLFDRKDPQAIVLFARVLTLLDDPDMEGQVAPDFKTVVTGFRDLSRLLVSAQSAPAGPPTQNARPPAAPTTAAPRAAASSSSVPPASSTPAKDAVVVPPVAVQRTMPRWEPPQNFAKSLFEGQLEVMVDQRGDVTAASLRQPIHPSYDQLLLRAARQWKFKPATKDGTPIPFVVTMPIRLQAP